MFEQVVDASEEPLLRTQRGPVAFGLEKDMLLTRFPYLCNDLRLVPLADIGTQVDGW